MIYRLLQAALRQRLLTIMGAVAVALFGLWAFSQLQIEAYPDISDTQVVLITQFPGHAAEEMEQQITIPIERAVNGAPNVIARRSRTIFGLSVVELTFSYGTDDYFARQVVLEKLRDADLPDGVTSDLAPLTTPTGELYRYVVDGPGHDEMELRELQDWVITPRFLQAPGVADVNAFGGLVKQYQVEVDPIALEKYGITVGQISKAISANNQNSGGAMLDNRQQSLVVRGVGLVRSTADIENIVLTASKGAPVFVRDVARVRIGPALQTGIFGLDSTSGGVEGLVLMRRGENPSEVLEGIRDAVEDLNSSRLPEGVRIKPIYDRTELVNNTLHTVSHTLLEGLIVVFLVLMFFLGSFRAAVLTALTIPLSLLFAFGCMKLYGVPASLLSLGALDFGIIVDGTLVMVEYVVRRLEARKTDATAFDVIHDAALAIERPILFSLLILVCAYIPLFTLERVERRLFTPMAFTVCAALVGSLLFTMTVVPVLATFLFRDKCKVWRNPMLGWLIRRYETDVRRTLRYPGLVLAGGLVLVAGALWLATQLGTQFLPQLDEGVMWIRANLPPGISLAKSAVTASDMRAIIRQSPEVRLVSSQSGRIDSGTDPFGPNRNELFVGLTPYSTWPKGKDKRQLVEELSARLRDQIPGADFNFTQPIIDMVTESVTGSSADLAVIVSGPDLGRLRELGGRTLTLVRGIRGSADTAIEQEADQPQMRIEIDRAALARYALNVADVQELIELAIGGKAVSTKFEGERKFDITVRYIPEARADKGALGNILVHTPDGGKVPLGQLAAIDVVNGASMIARRENQRQITVRTNIRGRDQGSYVAEAQQLFQKNIVLPEGYKVSWGGQFENLDRARRRLRLILPVTVGIIFALLFWMFGSARHAGVVLLNVPFSMVGGVVALYLRGINLSVSAAVGFVSLFGVAVMSGVLYGAEFNRRRREERGPLKEIVIAGASSQLRPRLILTVVAMLGMMPAALARGIGSDIQRPLATVVVGGLASTLLLTLLVLPAAYYLVDRGGEKRARREAEDAT
jgi:cobalt-zinc-cadmium resistance protein CzcA